MAGNGFFLLAVVPLWMAKVVMWSWGIELIYLGCVIGRIAVHRGLSKTGREV